MYWILDALRRTAKSSIMKAEQDRFEGKSCEGMTGQGTKARKVVYGSSSWPWVYITVIFGSLKITEV